MSETRTLQCVECHERFGEKFFRLHTRGTYTCPKRKLRCKCCEQNRRDAAKTGVGRFLKKAQNAFGHHARSFLHAGKIKSREELRAKYGWDVRVMAHDLEHKFSNGCHYCHRLYRTMANGLSSITLDIVDVKKEPYYAVNANWCCESCNREKQDMSPEEWAEHLLNWERAERARARIAAMDPFADSLLEGLLSSGGVITI